MNAYIQPITTALWVFPILAAVLTFPFALIQYHKYGAIPWQRVLIIFSFIFYLLTAYLLVILPLPSKEDPSLFVLSDHVELVPFGNFADFFKKYQGSFGLKMIMDFITSRTMLQTVFNIILTVPFGVYLHYYFKCSLLKTVLLSLGLSAFFELTQLSGLYGIYPGPYRTFDINDLATNTLGGLAGYYLAPAVLWVLPKRDTLDQIAIKDSAKVGIMRILCAMAVDWIICLFIYIIVVFVCQVIVGEAVTISLSPIYCLPVWLAALVSHGSSPGKSICRIRVVNEDGSLPTFKSLTIRYLLIWFPLYGLYDVARLISGWIENERISAIIEIPALIIQFVFWMVLFFNLFMPKKKLWFEEYSHTCFASTVSRKAE